MSKTILITGAGSGLGKGTALGLAKKGHQVIAGVMQWEQVTALRAEAQQAQVSDKLRVIKLDITDAMDCQHAQSYDIDILVNNAGIGETGPLAEIPVHLLRKVMETNVFATLELTQAFIKKMVANKQGKIVFVSSMAGLSTYPFLGPYNASKHALEAVAQCLRDELKPLGITVATINPGPYRTGFNDRMYESAHQWFDAAKHFTPEQPLRDIQGGLASPESQYDPQEMIAKMIEVIPAEQHLFRTMLPAAVEQWCKEYQQNQWTIEV
ncbi:MAG: SDR family oxidoreductase [Thiothrix sp.]|nr:MAG: SDR family oxidoreductase [Thiothrix sp.]